MKIKTATYQTDVEKAVLTGKFMPLNVCVQKEKTSQINNLIIQLKELENAEQTKAKASSKRNKIKTKSNKIENRKTVEKNQQNQVDF